MKNKRKKIIISGYYGFDNLGDEAILAGMIKSLKNEDKDIEITVMSAQPELTSARYEVLAFNRYNLKDINREISQSELLISGGGSLLQDITSFRTIPYYLFLVFLAQIKGKKTVFYGQGIGPIKRKINKKILKYIGNRTDLIIVREPKSKNLLIDLGIKPELIKVGVDPAFSLTAAKKKKSTILTRMDIERNKPLIGISIRPFNEHSYLPELAKGIDYLAKLTGAQILIIPFHQKEDLKISFKLQRILKSKSEIIDGNYTYPEILLVLKELDFLIGLRLHSLILATIANTPFLGISYDPKVSNYLDLLALNSHLTLDNLSVVDLNKILKNSWDKRKESLLILNKKTEEFKLKTTEMAKSLIELL